VVITMFNWAGKLFGTEKAIQSVVDNVSTGLDKLILTDEEKSDAVAADRSEARRMLIRWMEGTQGQNLARRILALGIASVWLSQYVLIGVMSVIAPWTETATGEKLAASVSALTMSADQMTGAMMLLLGFYFAAPHLSSIIGPAMAKFSGNSKGDKK